MSFNHGALVVFGSGPGVGRSVATVFAERGFEKVVLISRNADRLREDGDVVRAAHADAKVFEIPADLGNTEHVREALKLVDEKLEETPLECVLFNAARMGKTVFFDFEPEGLENDLRIAIVSLYAVAQWAMPKLLITAKTESKTPALLVTSGMLSKDPFPAMFSLATSKAGQYSLVHSLHKEFEPKGVHCAVIIIGGTVSDESKVTNARNIAKEAYKVFSQPKEKGKLELVLADPGYADHIKNRER